MIITFNFRFRFESNCVIPKDIKLKPDIVLKAFGKVWFCHRSVLVSQSNFFNKLLNGPFRESKMNEVELHTIDDLINETSFEKLHRSMHGYGMTFKPDEIFSLIVTAQYFQIDEIVDFCEEKISLMIKRSNAIEIYQFSDRYFFNKIRNHVFNWMLLRLFPVKDWSELTYLTVDLAEKLISDPRLVTQNEMYLYLVLKMLVQIQLNGTFEQKNESFYKKIRDHEKPFLITNESFRKAFLALRLENILVTKENVEIMMNDNIIPRSVIDECIFKNYMSLIAIESPDNFGPSNELVTKDDFETYAMRFAKTIHAPDFHSWKFNGFSYAFDLALFFDGRTLIIKRVHQINEHKISFSHLLRRIMLRWNICELNENTNQETTNKRDEIQTITMTTNEEICLQQLKREPKYPCRISIEVLFHIPYRSTYAENENTGSCFKKIIKTRAFKSDKRFF